MMLGQTLSVGGVKERAWNQLKIRRNQIMALWIRTDDVVEEVDMSPPSVIVLDEAEHVEYQLSELQRMVGGFIEFIQLPDLEFIHGGKNYGKFQIMVVNEEGFLDQLPVNKLATRLVNPTGLGLVIPIAGDVLLCRRGELL